MSDNDKTKPKLTTVDEVVWGQKPGDNLGYSSDSERLEKRGLEDWEMVEAMETSDQSIPYWFFAIFFVLLFIAVGLTFPFWGNRPGYERDWWDWGIPAGMAWVIVMSLVIYYFVDGRDQLKIRKEKKLAEQAQKELEQKEQALQESKK